MIVSYPIIVRDDAGNLVAGANVTVASVTDEDGNAIASPGATVKIAGSNATVRYDAEAKGEAWITLAISKNGSTFTGENASPAIFASKDSGRVLFALPDKAPATAGGLGTVDGSNRATIDKTGMSLAASQSFNNTGQTDNVPTQVKGMDTGVLTGASIASDAFGASKFSSTAIDKMQNGLARPGDMMALTGGAQSALATATAAAVEVGLVDDATNGAFMAEVAERLQEVLTVDNLTATFIATTTTNTILNRVLQGQHDTTGTVGALLQATLKTGSAVTLPSSPPAAYATSAKQDAAKGVLDVVATAQTSNQSAVLEAIGGISSGGGSVDLQPVLDAIGSLTFTLSTGERNALATAILTLPNGVESGLTLAHALQAIFAVQAGKTIDADTTAPKFRNAAGNKNRVTAILDGDGNRTDVVLSYD